ncbi:MAG: hypothetical protein QW579_04420 [Desulfurococcaceae archaeon]
MNQTSSATSPTLDSEDNAEMVDEDLRRVHRGNPGVEDWFHYCMLCLQALLIPRCPKAFIATVFANNCC